MSETGPGRAGTSASRPGRAGAPIAGLVVALFLGGCTAAGSGTSSDPGGAEPAGGATSRVGGQMSPGPSRSGTAASSPSPPHTPSPPQPPSPSQPPNLPPAQGPPAAIPPDPIEGWTIEQEAAQVLMVGVRTSAPQQLSHELVANGTVANVFLAGRTAAGSVRVANLVRWFTDDLPMTAGHGTPLLVATDQEGGQVQVLRGPRFSDIPAAEDQGRMAPDALRSSAKAWGQELASVGVNVDLAPVVDLPTPDGAVTNAPVGHLHRQYGFTVDDVVTHASAFGAGLADGRVRAVIKHFPGLGRVSGNPDVAAGVTDTTTDAGSEQVAVFRALIDEGAWAVMVSTADYDLLDPGVPAAFSPVVVGQLLRQGLGFTGLIVTDDLSAAAQVLAWTPGERAVLAIAAGCDLVLASRDPRVVPDMVEALTARAKTDPAFAARLADAARHVVAAKGTLL